MVLVPVDGDISIKDETKVLDTQYQIGRNVMTSHVMGMDGAEVSFSHALRGLAAAVGDGSSPASADSFGLLLNSAFGSSINEDGEGAASATAGDITLDTVATYALTDLLCVWETGVNSSYAQWRRITAVSGAQLTVDRNWADTPSGSAVAYGHSKWYPQDAITANSLALAVDLDGTYYHLKGCRPSAFSIEATAGEKIMCSWTLKANTKTEDTSGLSALPTNLAALEPSTAAPPIVAEQCTVEWNGTAYAAKSVKIDFGVSVYDQLDLTGTNGRSQIFVIGSHPTITFEPLYSTTLESNFRAGTEGVFSVHFGPGTVSGGVLNSVYFECPAAQITSAEPADDGGRWRQSIGLKVVDGGMTATLANKYWQLARA